jgi:hypothetical protein
MRPWLALGALGIAFGSASAALSAPTIDIRGVAARVTIIPEARSDIGVTIAHADARLPIRENRLGDHTYLTGDVSRQVHGCSVVGGHQVVSIWGRGDIPYDQLPQLVIRTPMDVRVGAGEAVFGEIGRSSSVDFTNQGCGSWTIADVQGRLRLNQAGSGDVRAGSAGASDLSVVGSGDIVAGEIHGGLKAISSSSGNVTVAAVTGPVDARVAGAGSIVLTAGRVTAMTASIAGSGSVSFDGIADSLHATIAGSGDVSVAKVLGPVVRQVFGSGAVRVNRKVGVGRWGPPRSVIHPRVGRL